MARTNTARWLTPVLIAMFALESRAQGPVEADPRFDFLQAMVPMRDGVRLNTTFFIPKGQLELLPILLVRTPYGSPQRQFPLSLAYPELVADGYIFAFQDIRGKYASEGTFVMQRALRPTDAGAMAIDESTVAYDSIDWLLKKFPATTVAWGCSA